MFLFFTIKNQKAFFPKFINYFVDNVDFIDSPQAERNKPGAGDRIHLMEINPRGLLLHFRSLGKSKSHSPEIIIKKIDKLDLLIPNLIVKLRRLGKYF